MSAERSTFASNGVAVEYLESVWRGDRYDFQSNPFTSFVLINHIIAEEIAP